MNVEILYEDENFLIVNKPAGLVVHATLDKNRENLFDILKTNTPELYLLHRLDKDTSGAILFTKNESVNKFVEAGFRTHTIKKVYQTIVSGKWDYVGELSSFLKKVKNHRGHEVMEIVSKGGVKALSIVKTLKNNQSYSLMEFELKTGRMHQIRIQCKGNSHPIVGDTVYDGEVSERMLLHSSELSFEFQGKIISAHAPLNNHFKNFMEKNCL